MDWANEKCTTPGGGGGCFDIDRGHPRQMERDRLPHWLLCAVEGLFSASRFVLVSRAGEGNEVHSAGLITNRVLGHADIPRSQNRGAPRLHGLVRPGPRQPGAAFGAGAAAGGEAEGGGERAAGSAGAGVAARQGRRTPDADQRYSDEFDGGGTGNGVAKIVESQVPKAGPGAPI